MTLIIIIILKTRYRNVCNPRKSVVDTTFLASGYNEVLNLDSLTDSRDPIPVVDRHAKAEVPCNTIFNIPA